MNKSKQIGQVKRDSISRLDFSARSLEVDDIIFRCFLSLLFCIFPCFRGRKITLLEVLDFWEFFFRNSFAHIDSVQREVF